GTTLWGDNAFGVRFFSPVLAAITSFIVLRFFAREVNGRAAFFLLLAITAMPLMSAGSILMTIDPLNVLFWTAAMIVGWYAIQEHGTTRQWVWVGVWMGFSFLSKYTALFQLLCWVVVFAVWKPARRHLRKPGPYLALLINIVFMVPVLVWNAQHGWITVTHVANDAHAGEHWHFTLKYFFEFMTDEFFLLNPVFFVAMIWAAIAFWYRNSRRPLPLYCFCMGAPLFLSYLLFTFHSRVLPNWIAPSVVPLFCFTIAFWDERFRQGIRAVKPWLITGLVIGFTAAFLFHDTDLIGRVIGRPLPAKIDPLRRVRRWREVALIVGQARQKLLAEGKPVFIICGHYGITGLISFYLPEAREHVKNDPFVYYRTTNKPENQFYFWPSYENREGQNAIYVRLIDKDESPPVILQKQFTKITDLGLRQIKYGDRVYHTIQLFDCYRLR
ncbi:MAG TPA: glycosyltransferase family 39 protein, partial [Verrucomicrobiae bacterium]|nr:glycosyltransferase family 39 protein [Verrucomicrobiae bacterium]